MLDLSYFQNNNSNVQGFFNGGTWQTWIKPRGAKLVNIICQGAGSGGGGGFQDPTLHGGGGSGASGATARLTIDANLLPDILYILPGIGGAGGNGGATGVASSGSSGQNSFVALIPNTSSAANLVLRSGTAVATGGTPGVSTGNGGSAGAGEVAGAAANNIFGSLGVGSYIAGVGGVGGAGGGPNNITPSNFIVTAGGGGATNGYSQIVATGIFQGVPATTIGGRGAEGFVVYKPTLLLYGGGGGGGNNSGNGGNGGNGAPGTGGGGGGGGSVTGVNAGNGGRGGDGFVIITTSL